MSEAIAFALLLLAVVGWLALPLLPALRELLRPTDGAPLAMVGQDAGDLSYFAERFRGYIDGQLARGGTSDGAGAGVLPDGTPWLAAGPVADREPVQVGGRVAPRRPVGALLLAPGDVRLPARATHTSEVFARGDLTSGEGSVLRAVLTDGACTLGPRSDVLRWVHAGGALSVGRDGTLHGRGTSADAIELEAGVRFARLRAPRISTRSDAPVPSLAPAAVDGPDPRLTEYLPAGAVRLGEGFWRVDGSLVIPPRSRVAANLVVRGDVRVGDGSQVAGAIKAHGSITLGRDVAVDGALVARRAVHAGAGARLGGAVIAEQAVHLASGGRVGSPERPATVAAPLVRLATGVTVHGAITTADGLVAA